MFVSGSVFACILSMRVYLYSHPMTARSLCSLIIVTFAYGLNGQSMPGLESDVNILTLISNRIHRNADQTTIHGVEVKGTPYVLDDWTPGIIALEDGRALAEDIGMNIDATQGGGLFVLMPNGDAVGVRVEMIGEVRVRSPRGDRIFKAFDARLLNSKESGLWLAEVLFENKRVALLKRHSKLLREPDYRGAYSSGVRYYQYVEESTYFIRIHNEYTAIRLSKGSIKSVSREIAERLKGKVTEQMLIEALGAEYGESE